jgi:hypothetical protein
MMRLHALRISPRVVAQDRLRRHVGRHVRKITRLRAARISTSTGTTHRYAGSPVQGGAVRGGPWLDRRTASRSRSRAERKPAGTPPEPLYQIMAAGSNGLGSCGRPGVPDCDTLLPVDQRTAGQVGQHMRVVRSAGLARCWPAPKNLPQHKPRKPVQAGQGGVVWIGDIKPPGGPGGGEKRAARKPRSAVSG